MYEKVVEHKKLPLYWSHFQGPLTDFKKIPHVLKIGPKNFTNEFHPSMCLLLHGSEPIMITLDKFAQKTILVSVLQAIVMIQNFDAIFSIFRYFTGG